MLKKLLFLFCTLLCLILLWPFEYAFNRRENEVRWKTDSKGLEFFGQGQLIAESNDAYIYDRLVKGPGLTLDTWIRTDNNHADGHARIVSYSQDTASRNFTLAQSGDSLIVRLRTTATDPNAIRPHLKIRNVFNRHKLYHIVVTYNFREVCVYVDGELRSCDETISGGFSNWRSDCRLVMGNEVTGGKGWQGVIYYVALYDRALAADTAFGDRYLRSVHESAMAFHPPGDHAGIIVQYTFNEGGGIHVNDSAKNSVPVNLYIPETLPPEKKHMFNLTADGFTRGLDNLPDIILNTVLFIPLGFLIFALYKSCHTTHAKAAAFTLLIGLGVTFGVEFLQFFIKGRNSSMVDVIFNTAGLMLGVVLSAGIASARKSGKHVRS